MISIIIPTHNGAELMRPMLESIKAQTYKDYEIIVVCDACEDESVNVAQAYGARAFEVNAHNSAVGRNKGLDEAKGEYILFCDDDDYWLHPYALEQIVTELKNKKDPSDMTQCSFVFGEKGVQPVNGKIWANVWSKVWKRQAIGDTRFDPRKFPADDLDFVNRMLAKGISVGYSTMLWYYYNWMRPGSITYGLNARVR